MDHYYLLQVLLMFFLILSLTSGRALFYDEYEGKNRNFFPPRKSLIFLLEQANSRSNIFDSFPNDEDISSEEKDFHQRSVFPSSSDSQTRQQVMDLLRKAYQQGWKPNLKHHMPATRFGRHRR
jgi:hypothetical protein